MSKPIPWTAPCCPSCKSVGSVVEMPQDSIEEPKPAPDTCLVHVWPQGSDAFERTDVGAWVFVCDCGWENQEVDLSPWPTVRSQTPPVVLAALESDS